jgi:hypothetical protein
MIEMLPSVLRVAGVGLILLAALHHPIGRHLKWSEDGARLSPVNASIFRVHMFFICLILVIMGLPCLIDPAVFLERTRAGAWLAWSFAGFWAFRLYCQWFVYERALWLGQAFETRMHWLFTFIWVSLTGLFTWCGCLQAGWL